MGMQERVRELCHYDTTFGSVSFNIASTLLSMTQILCTCVIFGAFRQSMKSQSDYFLWWPIIESSRLFVLTISRVDVLLKDFNDLRGNAQMIRSFAKTRRMILMCNFLGILSVCILGPIYLILLASNVNESSTLYLVCMIMYPIWLLTRIFLTIPMFFAFGGTPLYRLHNGNDYERIDDGPLGTNRNSESDPAALGADGVPVPAGTGIANANASGSSIRRGSRSSRSLPPGVAEAMYEERQMQLAMERSRRESERALRSEQDREYLMAEEEQRQLDEEAELLRARQMSLEENISDEDGDGAAAATESGHGVGAATDKGDGMDNDAKAPEIVLDPLPEEPDESNETILARIRLPNGSRLKRRFLKDATMADMKLWVSHELQKSGQPELIGEYRLISTMPRVTYDDDGKSMVDLKFWKSGHSRQLSTPLLYVEDLE